jgi:polar amino acid transport system substrate-binding protein
MKRIVLRLTLILCPLLSALTVIFLPSVPARAQTGTPQRVVIKPLVPFVFAEGDTYRGFSIDLWQEMAARMGRDYEYLYVDTITEQLDAVQQGRADLGITGITITKEREQTLDFSLPYFRSGLQILVPATGGANEWVTPIDVLRQSFSSPVFYRTLVRLAGLILIVGHVFWLLERKRNKDFPVSYVRGVWEGIWYSVVTLVTVGYGDRTARTVVGRLVAMGWMFISLLLVASFTANITSQLTVNHFQGLIQGPEDLPGKRIATVTGSTAASYLADRQIAYQGVKTVDDAYRLLDTGKVDAVVYDGPVLQYHALTEGNGRVNVVGEMFERQYYGIALPTGSPDREAINRTLLEIMEDGTYDRLLDRWFGLVN